MTSLEPISTQDCLIEGYEPVLRRLGLRLLGNPADADDVTQEALVASYLHDGDRVRDRRSWMRGVTRNMALQFVRSERRRRQVEKRPLAPRLALPPESELAAIELASTLERELGRLPASLASAVRGRYLDERSYESLAEEEGVASATIRTRVRRGLTRLRERVDRRLLDHLPAWFAFDLGRLSEGATVAAPVDSVRTSASPWLLASPLVLGVTLAVSMPNLIFGDMGPAPRDLGDRGIEPVALDSASIVEVVRRVPDTRDAAPIVGGVSYLREATGALTPDPEVLPPLSAPRLTLELGGMPIEDLRLARAWIVEGPQPAFYTGLEAEGPPAFVADDQGRLDMPELLPGQALLVRAPGAFALLGPPRDERWGHFAWLDEETGDSLGWTGRHGLDLRPGVDLVLRPIDGQGQALSGGRVQLAGKELTYREGVASGQEPIVLRDVPLGVAFGLTIQAEGAGSRVLGPFVLEFDPGWIEVELPEERQLTGRVVGPDGRPIRDAKLSIQVQESGLLEPLHPTLERLPGARRVIPAEDLVTDDQGNFTIGGLADGDYFVGARRKRLQGEAELSITGGDMDVVIEVEAPRPRLDWSVEVGEARLRGGMPYDLYASRIVDPFGWREYVGASGVDVPTVGVRGLVPGAWILQAVPEQGPASFRAGWFGEGSREVLLDGPVSWKTARVVVKGGTAPELGLFREDGSPVILRVSRERFSARVELGEGCSARLEVPDESLRAVVPVSHGAGLFLIVPVVSGDGVLEVDLSRGEQRRAVLLDRPDVESDREPVVALAWSAREGEVREWLRDEDDSHLLRPLVFESLDRPVHGTGRQAAPSWRLRNLVGSEVGRGAFLVPEGEGSVLLVEESGRRTHEVLDRGPARIDWR